MPDENEPDENEPGENEADENEAEDPDVVAVGWAWSTRSPTGHVVRERISNGGAPIADGELAEIRREWEAAGRPAPEQHVHMDVELDVRRAELRSARRIPFRDRRPQIG